MKNSKVCKSVFGLKLAALGLFFCAVMWVSIYAVVMLPEQLREIDAQGAGAVIAVFGAGGDRDTGKRPIMGEVASRLADACVITSDNPRTEEPASIAQAIAAGVPDERKDTVLVELDRHTAIVESICSAQDRDVILIAGKGHEDYQEIAGVRHPFDDLETAREAFNERYTRLAQKN